MSFQRYEQKLASTGYRGDEDSDKDPVSAKRVISLPNYVDGTFMATRKVSTCEPSLTADVLSGTESEQRSDDAAIFEDTWLPLPDDVPAYDFDFVRYGRDPPADYRGWMDGGLGPDADWINLDLMPI